MITKDIFFDNSKLNKNKLREDWFNNNYNDEYSLIKKFASINNLIDIKFSNLLYNYINDIRYLPKCELCNESNKRFIGFNIGYDKYCSKKCASKSSLPTLLETRKKNTIVKYGVDHTSKLDSVKLKQKNTNIEKYGFKSPTLNSDVKLKQENTMLERYGVKFTGESEYLMNKVFSTRFDKYKKDVLSTYNDLDIVNIEKEGEITIKCDVCYKEYDIRTDFLRLRHLRYKINPCLHCNPNKSYRYTGQNEIFDFLNDNNIKIIRNDRTILSGKEIDIYLPDYKIGIEFNGIYWHSSLFKDKKYHLNKKINAEKLGVNIINIWEDDWIYKKEIVKSRILNLIGIMDHKVFARKCKIVIIDSKTSKIFLDENHLQGSINASYNIGLVYNDELVSLMTFGKFRRSLGSKSKDGSWELYRFCSKLGYNVIGSFSRLLNKFEKDISPNKIVTYANRDWSVISSNVYKTCGFDFISETDINYWYFKGDKRSHRFSFRKDKLVKEGFDKTKTETEIMESRGYLTIYDCGNLKFEKNFGG